MLDIRSQHFGEDAREFADSFANSVNVAVEMDGVLSFHTSYNAKYSGLFYMDQTAHFMENPGKLTIDYRGTRNVDIIQGSAENGGRCSVFLCASATGEKLPSLWLLLAYLVAALQMK
ncbi:unnamed protein product [Phytophthora fragariaefolia]|uniref:Unnamed protein product n=1 Tax=Phytophthora fragariaefolia TaxID=1490495 RepID=A0A9W6XT93_9STRA|nr:unnamed protein product [Phytophthora fragariaefolia]